MAKIIDGRKAEITDKNKRFTMYRDFAEKHGYPEAAVPSDEKDSREKLENGDVVTLLTSGPHLTGYNGSTLWVVEAANGERHIINEVGLRIMPAQVSGITSLPDDSLGGVLREYREVKRTADAGETVIMTEATGTKTVSGREVPDYHNGDTFVIDHISGGLAASTSGKLFYHREYSVLEPTEILVIDGERFRLVDRKAAVGERVIIVNDRNGSGGSDGEFFRVGNVGVYCGDGDVNFNGCGNSYVYRGGKWSVSPYARRVLEPVLSGQAAEPQATANIATLTLKVTELEAQVKALYDWHRRAAIDLRVAREDIILIEEGVSDDIKALDERITALEVAPADRKAASGPVDKALPSFANLGVMKSAAVREAALSPQEIRDEIVERAKADVKALSVARVDYVPALSGLRAGFNMGPGQDVVKFEVNPAKRTVVALLYTQPDEYMWARGIAKCAPGETFNAHIGRAIALRRALGLAVPAEYLDAPGPTEVRVGDVITFGSVGGRGTLYEVLTLSPGGENLRIIADKYAYMVGEGAHGGDLNDGQAIITDDSREDTTSSSALKGAA